nr:unnamed protein product [Digitaria exilis]
MVAALGVQGGGRRPGGDGGGGGLREGPIYRPGRGGAVVEAGGTVELAINGGGSSEGTLGEGGTAALPLAGVGPRWLRRSDGVAGGWWRMVACGALLGVVLLLPCSACTHREEREKGKEERERERFAAPIEGRTGMHDDLLYPHIVSDHAQQFRLLDVPQRPNGQSVQQTEGTSAMPLYDNLNADKDDGTQKLTCKLCGLKFDLLPDLRRHHQVAHMESGAVDHIPPEGGKYQLNRGRHYFTAFRKSLRPTSTLKKRSRSGIEKNLKFQSSGISMVTSQTVEPETASLGKLTDVQCSDVAQTLFSKIQKTRPHPSNLDILSVARSVCCKTSLLAALEVKFGSLPENIFVKAAKLCSDNGIQIDWHQEEFICPKGCKSRYDSNALPPIQPMPADFPEVTSVIDPSNYDEMWDMDECHYVLDSKHFGWNLKKERVVLCEDEGYPVYECNSSCTCDSSCQNKVLQKGLLVKLELFRSENKGWAIRAAEPIPQGTFVCEYIGEIVKTDETMKNAEKVSDSGCSYLFDIASQIDMERVQTVGTIEYMIDATRSGNVSRFINHRLLWEKNSHMITDKSL